MKNISFDPQGKISFEWERIPGKISIKYLSIYKGIIWGVTENDQVYFRLQSSSGS